MADIIKISEVKVSDRLRKETGDIQSLKESIKRIGLLHPIGITKDNTLVYGFRRLQAAKLLGWEEIPYVLVDLDNTSQQLAELEENLKRKDMTWQEEIKGKAELHRLCQTLYGPSKAGYRSDVKKPLSDSEQGWSLKKLAELLNESIGLVSQDLKLNKALEEHPELSEAPTKSSALRLLQKLEHPKKTLSSKGKELKCDLCGNKLESKRETSALELCLSCYSRITQPQVTRIVEFPQDSHEITNESAKVEGEKLMTMQEWLGIKDGDRTKKIETIT